MVSKRDIEKFDEGSEPWDSKQLGASLEHAQSSSDEYEKVLDEATGLQLLSFRIQKTIIEQLRELAKLEGIGYQPLMRRILTNWVRENKDRLKQSLTPSAAIEKADKLFAKALKLRREIPRLAPFSDERIFAEGDYSKVLSQAQTLFAQALDTCKNLVLKQHSKHRLKQIADLCQEDVQHTTKVAEISKPKGFVEIQEKTAKHIAKRKKPLLGVNDFYQQNR